MNKLATCFSWIAIILVLSFAAITVVDHNKTITDWDQKCKQDNGYLTNVMYMDWHSNWHRLCINPRSVVEVD